MSGRKNVGALAGVTVVAMTASALLAWATIDAPPLPVKHKKTEAATTPAVAATPVTPVAVAPLTTDPPPAPKPAPKPTPKPTERVAEPAAKPAAKPADNAAPAPSSAATGEPTDWTKVTLDELRNRANRNDVPAMDELARRLLQGIDIAKDPQAGTGWLLRAAALGSAPSAFNIGVMYERGFVVERDSSKAAVWYRKAADEGLPTAKHNLALLLRDGKGVPRDMKTATDLLLSAARQGMAASMFTLGDIYEQGDGGTKDPAAALAWFAVAGEFERQTGREADSTLARTAGQRAQALKRTLTTVELEHAQEIAQTEFKQIVAALTPPLPPGTAAAPPAPPRAPPPAPPPLTDAMIDWPKGAADQVRAIQQALVESKRLRDKPDGNLGPQTRAAIRDFQKSAGMKPTGEPTREVYIALMSARQDIVRDSPLPAPPSANAAVPAAATIDLGKPEPPPSPPTTAEIAASTPPPPAPQKVVPEKIEPLKIEPLKIDPPKVEAPIDLGKSEPPPAPPTSAEVAAATPPPRAPQKVEVKKVEAPIDLGMPAPPPAPPTSAEIAAATPKPPAPQKVDPPKPLPVAVDTATLPKAEIEVKKIEVKKPGPANDNILPAPVTTPPPTSAEIARSTPPPPKPEPPKVDPNVWPVGHADQVKAVQTLLRDLRFYTKKIDGLASGATHAAIRDYERMAGLKETGEPSKALFDSLKEMRKLMAPAPAH